MNYEFDYSIKINIILPRKVADIIYEHVSESSDTSWETRQGGLVHSFVNSYKGKDVPVRWGMRAFDTVLKALELRLELNHPKEYYDLKKEVKANMKECLSLLKKEREEIYRTRSKAKK